MGVSLFHFHPRPQTRPHTSCNSVLRMEEHVASSPTHDAPSIAAGAESKFLSDTFSGRWTVARSVEDGREAIQVMCSMGRVYKVEVKTCPSCVSHHTKQGKCTELLDHGVDIETVKLLLQIGATADYIARVVFSCVEHEAEAAHHLLRDEEHKEYARTWCCANFE